MPSETKHPAGHVIAGSILILYGLVTCIKFIWYHLKTEYAGSKLNKPSGFESSSFFAYKRKHDLTRKSWIPLPFTQIPVEPIIKIVLPTIGAIVEEFFTVNGKGHLATIVYSIWDKDNGLNSMSRLHIWRLCTIGNRRYLVSDYQAATTDEHAVSEPSICT